MYSSQQESLLAGYCVIIMNFVEPERTIAKMHEIIKGPALQRRETHGY
jgi:hypothetical protein